ncbi:MAG: hypothetical protein H7A37_08860 [Chlamydiales bacterium]|nr:hypothetical protein [Chlamydiales bacterium]
MHNLVLMMINDNLRSLYKEVSDSSIYTQYQITWNYGQLFFSTPKERCISALFDKIRERLTEETVGTYGEYLTRKSQLRALKAKCQRLKENYDSLLRSTIAFLFTKTYQEEEEVESSWKLLAKHIDNLITQTKNQFSWKKQPPPNDDDNKAIFLFEYYCHKKSRKAKSLYEELLKRNLTYPQANRVYQAASKIIIQNELYLATSFDDQTVPCVIANVHSSYSFSNEIRFYGYGENAAKTFLNYLREGIVKDITDLDCSATLQLIELLIIYQCSNNAVTCAADHFNHLTEGVSLSRKNSCLALTITDEEELQNQLNPILFKHVERLDLAVPCDLPTDWLCRFHKLDHLSWTAPQSLVAQSLNQLPHLKSLTIDLRASQRLQTNDQQVRNNKIRNVSFTNAKTYPPKEYLALVNCFPEIKTLVIYDRNGYSTQELKEIGKSCTKIEELIINNANCTNKDLHILTKNQQHLNKISITGNTRLNFFLSNTRSPCILRSLFKVSLYLRELKLSSYSEMNAETTLQLLYDAVPYLNKLTLVRCLLTLESLTEYIRKQSAMQIVLIGCSISNSDEQTLLEKLKEANSNVRLHIEDKTVKIIL